MEKKHTVSSWTRESGTGHWICATEQVFVLEKRHSFVKWKMIEVIMWLRLALMPDSVEYLSNAQRFRSDDKRKEDFSKTTWRSASYTWILELLYKIKWLFEKYTQLKSFCLHICIRYSGPQVHLGENQISDVRLIWIMDEKQRQICILVNTRFFGIFGVKYVVHHFCMIVPFGIAHIEKTFAVIIN